MSIRSYDEQIAALQVENAELRLQCVEWREDWTECQAAIARVRAVCRKDPWALDGEHTIKAVLTALEPNETIDTNRTGE